MSDMLPTNSVEPAEPPLLLGWLTQLWRHKWLGVALVVVALGLAVTYLHIASYKYSAVLTVTPADQSGQKPMGNLASLGSLVGVDLTSQAGSAFAMYAEAAVSYPVAESLSRQPELMRAIFKQSWDPVTRQWREPKSLPRSVIQGVKQALGVPIQPWTPPDGHDLQTYIEKNVAVTEDKKKAFVRLSYLNEDPQLAVKLLNSINTEADNFLRRRSLERTSRYVDYLERRLAEIEVVEYRLSMAQVLGNYEKTQMMASSDTSFAAESFGEVWVSPNFTTPNPWIILGFATLGAIALWVAVAIFALPAISRLRGEVGQPD